ncbi:MAG: TRC40/GET3/ArsA family transport-energizing ATPase [bacterium]
MQTKFYFFSGKGGVGKTTMSVATAIHYANQGLKILIITTDPASNLADVFEQKIGAEVVMIEKVPNLSALELDPDKAIADYKTKTLAPLRGLLPEASFKVLEEQLNSPCTAEMATFERFTDFVQENTLDVIIFDTAPTGHTLRLLQLPVEWSNVIEKASKEGSSGQTCIGPAAALAQSKDKFDKALAIMRDQTRTSFVFVMKAEATSIFEVSRTLKELALVGIRSTKLIVNGLLPKEYCDNTLLLKRFSKQQQFLLQIKNTFDCETKLIKLHESEIVGLEKLNLIAKQLFENPVLLKTHQIENADFDAAKIEQIIPKLSDMIFDRLIPEKNGTRKIFFAGKGGVGKSSVAAATALWLSEKGYKTLLLTTDPASHLAQIFEQDISDKPTLLNHSKKLYITYIDTKKATQAYKEKVLTEANGKYDTQRLLAIKEELDSPCTEEMATFEKFIDYASNTDYQIVVFDTAPTGHTLRLLELPIEWNKQLEIKTFTTLEESAVDQNTKSKFKAVIAMLQDPAQTTFCFVMYPERTPLEEASRAVEELSSIGIPVELIIANLIIPQAFATNSFLKSRLEMQKKYLILMNERFAVPILHLPLMANDIIGIENIREAGKLLLGN